jgi:hypothetical protein
MIVVRRPECRADSLGQLVGTEHSSGLYNLALTVDPLGLYRTLSHGLRFGKRQLMILTPWPLLLTLRL